MRTLIISLFCALCCACGKYAGVPQQYHALLDAAFEKAGANKAELEKALSEAPAEQKEGMAFLIAYMPERDLTTLSADFLLTNTRLAYEARARFPWAQAVPDSVFLNDVLPYVSLNEERDSWREDFYKRFTPYVENCKTLREAIEAVNRNIRDEVKVKDELRLKYRYLDLRRPSMHDPIVLRSKICQIIRNYYCDNHFCEIETPMLIKSTPEGARDYLVPSRVQPGHFYALPQSPQLYKQILMLSGFDRYFQIARCFRDEDLRADRQPEFTQVDLEMSFVTEEDIMTLNEGLIKKLWKEILNIDVATPFQRMPWDEAMARYGSDKPDTRFGLEIIDVTDAVRSSEFAPFKGAIEAGGSVRLINCKGLADKLTRKTIDKLGDVAKTYGAKGLAYTRLTAEGETSSFEKFLTEEEKTALRTAAGAETGDVLLVVSDADNVRACTALGQVRLEVGRRCELIDPDKFNFLWVVKFPLFEYSEEEGRYMAMHHPFTMPTEDSMDKLESEPGKCYANTTWCSTAASWAAVPSASTTRPCRTGCSRPWASPRRRPARASAS